MGVRRQAGDGARDEHRTRTAQDVVAYRGFVVASVTRDFVARYLGTRSASSGR